MIEIRELRGAEEMAPLYDLRSRVLRPGCSLEESVFHGDDDPETIHLGAFMDGRCVGIATLMADRGLRLRGMAVDPEQRGLGVGAALVRRYQEIATERGQDLWCNARLVAVGFYEKLGWTIEGDLFEIPPIGPHYVMRWRRPNA